MYLVIRFQFGDHNRVLMDTLRRGIVRATMTKDFLVVLGLLFGYRRFLNGLFGHAEGLGIWSVAHGRYHVLLFGGIGEESWCRLYSLQV